MKMKYLAAAVAVVMCAAALPGGAAGLPVSADDQSEIYRLREVYGDNVVFLGDEPEEDGLDEPVSAARTLEAGTGSSFLDRCEGERYGLRDIPLRSSAADREAMYRQLDTLCREVWNSRADIDNGVSSKGRSILFKVDNTDKELTPTEAVECYFTYMYDNPIYYYLSVYIGWYSSGSIVVYTSPDYLSASTRANYESQIRDFIEGSKTLVKKRRSAYSNIYDLHSRVCDRMTYGKADEYSPYDIIGGIVKGRGVCESYAKIFSLLMNYNGIDNAMVAGVGYNGSKNADGSLHAEDHAWNMARFDDGKYYNLDVTWSDSGAGMKYFAAGSRSFEQDHVADTPENTSTQFLCALPERAVEDFDNSKTYFDPLWYDYDGTRTLSNRDLKALQKTLMEAYDFDNDVNEDGVVDEADIRALQMVITEHSRDK